MSQKISISAELVGFFFTVQLLIGLEKVFNYLREGYLNPSRIFLLFLFKTGNVEVKDRLFPLPQVPLEAPRGVPVSSFIDFTKKIRSYEMIMIKNFANYVLLIEVANNPK